MVPCFRHVLTLWFGHAAACMPVPIPGYMLTMLTNRYMHTMCDTKELLPLSQFSQSLADKVVGKVDALCGKVDAMSALLGVNNSKLDALNKLAEVNNSKLEAQNKLAEVQTLQWAIQALAQVLAAERKARSGPLANPSVGSFEYYLGTERTISTSLAMEILFSFMRGAGIWITNFGFVNISPDPYARMKQDEAGRAAFRTKLSAQIHSLIGRKPRLANEINGKEEQWAMYPV